MKTKKWQRRALRILGFTIIILIVLFFSLTRTIDTAPYFKTAYYKNSIENMNLATDTMQSTKGSLLAGFGKVSITPPIKTGKTDVEKSSFNAIKLSGFGDGKIAVGVHDSIFVKAIAVEVNRRDLVFISADLISIPESVVKQVTENLKGKLSREQLFFGATHTHSSIGNCMPGFIGEIFEGKFQPDIVKWLSDRFTKAIIEALNDKKTSKFSSTYIKVPNLIRNRIIGEAGRLNSKLTVISFVQNQGRRAVIGMYSAHATTIGSWNDNISGDYPGYFQRSLESKDIDMAMFYAETVGSQSPQGDYEKFDKAEFIGKTLADSAIMAVHKMTYDSIVTLTSVTTYIEIPEIQAFYISDNRRLSPFIDHMLFPEVKSIPLQGVKINNLVWLTMPYELSGEYGIDLKNALELEGYNSALTSFNGQYLGYIVPSKYYYYDTYEARLMGWYGPSMGDYLMELNYKIANTLTNTKL
ncbi:neutral/alkaline non-lysosomal ceramidase N-terminal domain-containing protein [Confluentibacter sediminis]|uniref:neutral/alkaline non-lysosomal ceramidase N-terminal domain-containing protein n=1 Tax=Confluentibacter sediminis TaxID=2219045 RepID=UPI0013A6DA22|nr:neutral/alkaline non-lysosomal ceramidase N-terminal domain-containing protein [Confluentibacter sediminis]